MSPRFAPATKKGPVCGFPYRATTWPFSSTPPESIVRVATTSPGWMIIAGGRSAVKVLEKLVGS